MPPKMLTTLVRAKCLPYFVAASETCSASSRVGGDIGHAVQEIAESQGFSIVRDYCGHGIGAKCHEDPQVLHSIDACITFPF